MGDMVKGFSSGFGLGAQFGGFMNDKRKARDLKALDEERKRGLGRPATLDELNAANAETDRLQQSDTDTFELTSEEQAKFNNRKVESGTVGLAPMSMQDYYSRKAAVYNKYGNHQMADQLDQRAYQMGRDEQNAQRQSRMDESTLKTQAQQREYTGLQIGALQDTANTTAKMRQLETELQKDPSLIGNPTAIQEMANRLGVPLDAQRTLVDNLLKLDTGTTALATQQLLTEAKQYKTLAELLHADKTSDKFFPGVYHQLRPTKGGFALDLVKDGKVVQPGTTLFTSEDQGYAYLMKKLESPALVAEWLLAQHKGEAAIEASEASAAKDRAHADLYGRTDPNRAGSGGSGADYVKALLPQMRAERVDAKRALAEAIQLAGNDPKKIDAAKRQYEATMQEIDEHYAQYGARTPRAGADFAPPPRPKDGNQPPPADAGKVTPPAKQMSLEELATAHRRLSAAKKELDSVDGNWIMPESNPALAKRLREEIKQLEEALEAHRRAGRGLGK